MIGSRVLAVITLFGFLEHVCVFVLCGCFALFISSAVAADYVVAAIMGMLSSHLAVQSSDEAKSLYPRPTGLDGCV